MALTPSTMVALGTSAPDFSLPDTEGKIVTLSENKTAKGYLVIFMCNHCPYVKHIAQALSQLTNDYIKKGIATYGISSNDITSFPEDSPAKMKTEKEKLKYHFPYLFDETQNVARKYEAACTPDFFLFDDKKKLVYRGQFDDSRPGNKFPVLGNDLKLAMDTILAGKVPAPEQRPSLGCNIKWKS